MPMYTCEKCFKEFPRKSGYDSHMSRKTPCKPVKFVEKVIEEKAVEIAKSLSEDVIVLPEDEDARKLVLQKFFEDLHNLLWSSAGLSPEKALEHMTFFFAYRLLEEQADTLGLPSVCRWSHIASIKDEHDLFEKIKKGYVEFKKNPITTHFFKQPEISKAMVVYNVVKLIDKLPLKAIQESDTLGAIFEYMLGRGMSSMSDEGQYFTNRKICELAFELAYLIKKTIRRADGTLNTFADWFCGTGGFPAEFVKGVAHKAAEAGELIDWSVDSKSIYCQDMSLSSVSTTLLNMLILTGTLFSSANIRGGNSFTDQITIGAAAPFKDVKIDYCFMNPPYGGDKTKGKDYKFAYAKGKGASKIYLVNQEIQSIGIEDDDKVSAGVQLAMATLSSDGVCAIVLPQGFFFGASKKAVELRKKIAEEYNIHYVVDIASGAFVNTGTKTSMLVFQKGGLTECVKFIDMDEKVLVEASLDDMRKKNYSLNYKQYLAQEAVEVDGFEMVKLSELVNFSGGKFTTTFSKENPGQFPFFSGKTHQPDGTCSSYCFDGEEYLVLIKDGGSGIGNYSASIGMGKSFYVQGKSAGTSHNVALHKKSDKVLLKYLHLYLNANRPKIMDLAKYTTGLGVISQGDLADLQIPLPSLERQKQIVEAIDGWTVLAQHEEHALNTLEKQVMFQVKEMGRGKERVKLGEVCEIKPGKGLTKEDLAGGNVPVIGGGVSPMGYHNVHNKDAFTTILAQVGANAGNVSRYPVNSWVTNNGMTAHPNKTKLGTDDILYYILKNIQDDIKVYAEGTAQPKLNAASVLSITVQIPSLAEQQTIQLDFDEIRHKHAKIACYKEKAQEAIQRLIPGA